MFSLSLSIHLAVNNGDELIYDLLEKSGALISAIVTCGNNTLLHWFCSNDANDQHRSLLNKLIDIHINIIMSLAVSVNIYVIMGSVASTNSC